jgi:glycosyltransferase involved in cell wall biosynthesis
MRILYIDKANSLEEIRIAERTIWVDEFPRFGHTVFYLLKKIRSKSTRKEKMLAKNVFLVPFSKFGVVSLLNFTAKLVWVLRTKNVDLVVVRNVADLGIISFVITRLFQIKLMYIKAFPLIETKIRSQKERGLNKVVVIFLRQVLKVEIFIMKKSTYLISRTENFSQFLNSSYNVNREILAIPMGIKVSSLHEISEDRCTSLKAKYNVNDSFSLIYFGSLNRLREIDFIIDVVERVSRIEKNIKCFIIGGPKSEQLRLVNLIEERGLNKYFILMGEMDRGLLFEHIQICNVSISAIPPIQEYILSSPTKVIESVALGCPVIVNEEIVDQQKFVKDSNAGVIVSYDVDEFACAVLDLIAHKSHLERMAQDGVQYVLKHRSYKKLASIINKYIG